MNFSLDDIEIITGELTRDVFLTSRHGKVKSFPKILRFRHEEDHKDPIPATKNCHEPEVE